MAVDLTQLKADLNKIQEVDLATVRVMVDDALLVHPDEALADQEILAVFAAFKANRDCFVRVSIQGQPTPGVFNTTTVSALTQVDATYTQVRRWLFNWFAARN